MPKPAIITPATLLATKGDRAPVAVSGALQRGQKTKAEDLVDLNFKVPPAFRNEFKELAWDARLNRTRFLMRVIAYWKEGQGTT
jgi:hypothetical protein